MKRIAFAMSVLAVATTALPVAAWASAPVTATAVVPAPTALRQKALRLAQLTNPEAESIENLTRVVSTTVLNGLKATPEFQVMEENYPGVTAATVQALLPLLHIQFKKRLPELWGEIADIYEPNLTLQDLTQLVSFFEGPTGQRVVKSMLGNLTVSETIKAGIAAPNKDLPIASITKDMNAAAVQTVTELPATDRRALAVISFSPAGRKLAKLNPLIAQISAKWGNASDDAEQAEATEVIKTAIFEYMERKDAERAASANDKKGH